MDIQANHALIRFGLGRKGTEPLPSDPQSWLAAQLDGPDHALDTPGASAQDGLAALQEMRQDKTLRGRESPAAVIFKAERDALFSRLLTSDAPFRERLVLFW